MLPFVFFKAISDDGVDAAAAGGGGVAGTARIGIVLVFLHEDASGGAFGRRKFGGLMYEHRYVHVVAVASW